MDDEPAGSGPRQRSVPRVPLAYRHIALGAGVLAARAADAALSAPARLVAPAAGAALGSPLLGPARRTAERALGDLADLGGRWETRARLTLEQAGQDLLRGPLVDQLVAALAEARVIERVVERLLDEEVAERIVVVALESPTVDRIVQRVVESPSVERAVASVLESNLVSATTDRVLVSAELQRVVERVANSPEVRNAIAQQSFGLADVVAQEMRSRSVTGDDTAERIARSVLRRRPRRLGGGPS